MTERIVAAAIYHGSTISLPPPARHHTILQAMDLTMGIDATAVPPANQGFLTSDGRFVGRTEGFHIAWKAGQGKLDAETPVLYSEDLW
jgi:hypothetical protein